MGQGKETSYARIHCSAHQVLVPPAHGDREKKEKEEQGEESRNGEILIFDIEFAYFTSFNIQFVSFSKYNTEPLNSFDLGFSTPFLYFSSFLFLFTF